MFCGLVQSMRIEAEKWGDNAPPDWGVFRQLFTEIGRRFVGTTESMYLHITGLENWLFDEFQVVKEELAPRRFPYVLLSPLTSGNSAETQRQETQMIRHPLPDGVIRAPAASTLRAVPGSPSASAPRPRRRAKTRGAGGHETGASIEDVRTSDGRAL